MMNSPFDRSGLASLDDINTVAWKGYFDVLEPALDEFLAGKPHVPEYRWPRDPLHNCIRVWEYPYIYHQFSAMKCSVESAECPVVVDLGSGATFFPFAVARLGYNVIAVDDDDAAVKSVERACKSMPVGSGSVRAVRSDARDVRFESGSVDWVYSVSVIEHIPDFEAVIREVARILKPGGYLALTFDVGLRGPYELGPGAYTRLLAQLNELFEHVHPEKTIHPIRVLTSDNSPYPFYGGSDTLRAYARKLHAAYCQLVGKSAEAKGLLVSTYGALLKKR